MDMSYQLYEVVPHRYNIRHYHRRYSFGSVYNRAIGALLLDESFPRALFVGMSCTHSNHLDESDHIARKDPIRLLLDAYSMRGRYKTKLLRPVANLPFCFCFSFRYAGSSSHETHLHRLPKSLKGA